MFEVRQAQFEAVGVSQPFCLSVVSTNLAMAACGVRRVLQNHVVVAEDGGERGQCLVTLIFFDGCMITLVVRDNMAAHCMFFFN